VPLAEAVSPLTGSREDYEPLVVRARDARFALHGAARRPSWSHYFEAALATQFDAVIHFDHTRALEPLELTSESEDAEFPETYPFAV
jgi:erythromycin esterase-like protein